MSFKKDKIAILMAVLCLVFLIGAFLPYYQATYEKYCNLFNDKYWEYKAQKDEAEEYRALAMRTTDRNARQRYEKLAELTNTAAEIFYDQDVAPLGRIFTDALNRRDTVRTISGVLSAAALVGFVIRVRKLKKSEKTAM